MGWVADLKAGDVVSIDWQELEAIATSADEAIALGQLGTITAEFAPVPVNSEIQQKTLSGVEFAGGPQEVELLSIWSNRDWKLALSRPVKNLLVYVWFWRGDFTRSNDPPVTYTFNHPFEIASGLGDGRLSSDGRTLTLDDETLNTPNSFPPGYHFGILRFPGLVRELTAGASKVGGLQALGFALDQGVDTTTALDFELSNGKPIRRVGRTSFLYEFDVLATNLTERTLQGTAGLIESSEDGPNVVHGDLDFGDIPPFSSVSSVSPILLEINRATTSSIGERLAYFAYATSDSSGDVVVPDVRGLTESAAISALESAGFLNIAVRPIELSEPNVAYETTYGSLPPPGAHADPRIPIRIYLAASPSLGPPPQPLSQLDVPSELNAVRSLYRFSAEPSEVSGTLADAPEVSDSLVAARLRFGATVSDLNRALHRLGAAIVSMSEYSPVIVLQVPKANDVADLSSRLDDVTQTVAFIDASPETFPDEDLLPPPSVSITNEILQAARFPAAWNLASSTFSGPEPPSVLIMNESFDYGPPDRVFNNISTFFAPYGYFLSPQPFHGYAMMSLISGVFPISGAYQGEKPINVSSLGKASWGVLYDRMTKAVSLEVMAGNQVVVNFSGGLPPSLYNYFLPARGFLLPDTWLALAWRIASGPGKAIFIKSAGNDGDSVYSTPDGLMVRQFFVNSLVVENRSTNGELYISNGVNPKGEPTTQSSNYDGHISAYGADAQKGTQFLAGPDPSGSIAANPTVGTSGAAALVSGLAVYLASLPTFDGKSMAEIRQIILGTAVEQESGAPVIDAYAAVLAGDVGRPLVGSARWHLFNTRGGTAVSSSEIFDLLGFGSGSERQDVNMDGVISPDERDWSRYDLNGDGYTDRSDKSECGSSCLTAPFDLNRNGIIERGKREVKIGEFYNSFADVTTPLMYEFDESAVTDVEIICYYTPLFTTFEEASSPLRDTGLCGHTRAEN